MVRFLIGAAALVLAPGVAQGVRAADTVDGKAVFQPCVACHSRTPGEIKVGPSLAGIIGRKAGSIDGFNYSPAMKGSGLVWDEATLRRYLANPKAVVPGTKMVFPGVKGPRRLDSLIAYLKQGGK